MQIWFMNWFPFLCRRNCKYPHINRATNGLWNNPGDHGDRIPYVRFDLCLLGITSRIFKLHLYLYAAVMRDHFKPLQNKRLAFQFAFNNGERRASTTRPLFGRTTWIYSFCAWCTLEQISVCHLSSYVILLAVEASICFKHNFPWDYSTLQDPRGERGRQIEAAFTAPESSSRVYHAVLASESAALRQSPHGPRQS